MRGYADQFLRVKSNPYDPSNRRITILVKNQDGSTPSLQLAHAKVVCGARRQPRTSAPAAPSRKSAGAAARRSPPRPRRGAPLPLRRRSPDSWQADLHAARQKEISSMARSSHLANGRHSAARSQLAVVAWTPSDSPRSLGVYGVLWSADQQAFTRRIRLHGHRCRRRFRHTQRSRHSR